MDEQTFRKILKEELKDVVKKEELKGVIKEDKLKMLLDKQSTDIIEDLSNIIKQFAEELDEKKADKTQTLSLQVSINKLERKVFPNQ